MTLTPEPSATMAPPPSSPPGPPADPPHGPNPPPDRDQPWRGRQRWERAGDLGSVVWGLILVAAGGWFFLEYTLGFDLPRIDWSIVWPIVIILIGGWIVLRATGRRAA